MKTKYSIEMPHTGYAVLFDHDQVIWDNSGEGTPVLVTDPRGDRMGTFQCAVETGEIESWGLPFEVHAWLLSERVQSEVDEFWSKAALLHAVREYRAAHDAADIAYSARISADADYQRASAKAAEASKQLFAVLPAEGGHLVDGYVYRKRPDYIDSFRLSE